MKSTILSLLLAVAVDGQNYIRVESGGQSYVVDADSYAVQKNLKRNVCAYRGSLGKETFQDGLVR